MSKFRPQKGMYFYVRVKPWTTEHEDFTGSVTTRTHVDRSYQGDVFYCHATDDLAIAGERVFGGTNWGVQLFDRDSHVFDPVGPEIMAVIRPQLKHSTNIEEQ